MRRTVLAFAKNALLAAPPMRRAYERARLRRGYDRRKDSSEYALGVFAKHREGIERVRPVSGRVLEIGPGGNVAVAALFVKAGGSEAVCADVYPWAEGLEPLYAALGVDDVLDRVRYVCPCTAEEAPFPDGAFDIVYSHAAFEHFRDPTAATRNIARMLAPSGVTTHQVDFRDHLDFERPLGFLRFSDRLWALATRNLLWSTNRWRASDLLDAFRAAGLEVVEARPTDTVVVTERQRRSFARRFRDKALDDLGTLGLFVVAVKRAGPAAVGGARLSDEDLWS